MLETGTIEMTPEAATKVHELQGGDPKRALLRLYVMGKTCCSYQYGLAFDATQIIARIGPNGARAARMLRVVPHAARTVERNLSTSSRMRLLSVASDCADDNT